MTRLLRILFLIGYLFWLTPVQAQHLRSVICTVPESWNGRQASLVVSPLDGPRLIDTTTIHHQEAIFTVNMAEPCPAYVWIENKQEDIPLFLDAPRIQITVDETAQSQLFDSPSSARYEEVQRLLRAFGLGDLPEKLLEAMRVDDLRSAVSCQEQINALHLAYANALAEIIESDPTAPLNWYLFASNYDFLPYNQGVQLFKKLSSASSYPSYKRIEEKLSRRQLGKQAPNFNLPAPDGQMIRLAKVKSRFILIDFYDGHLITASVNHARLRSLYAAFHPRGLEIISVAFTPEARPGRMGCNGNRCPGFRLTPCPIRRKRLRMRLPLTNRRRIFCLTPKAGLSPEICPSRRFSSGWTRTCGRNKQGSRLDGWGFKRD